MTDKNEPTVGERLKALSRKKSDEALEMVDEWHKTCLWHMENAASIRKNSERVEVHSVEERQCSSEAFVDEFTAAADALEARLEADGSVNATYTFLTTKDETMESGGESRHFPAAHKLIFHIRW